MSTSSTIFKIYVVIILHRVIQDLYFLKLFLQSISLSLYSSGRRAAAVLSTDNVPEDSCGKEHVSRYEPLFLLFRLPLSNSSDGGGINVVFGH